MDAGKAIEKIAEQWIVKHVLMAAASKLLGDNNDLQSKVAKNNAANVAMATSDAAVAGAATLAYYSTFAPEAAPEMAALQYTLGMGFASLASFTLGGVSPKTQVALVHGGERVLTESQNTVFERLIEQRGKSSGAPPYNPTFNMSGVGDPETVARRAASLSMACMKSYYRSNGVKR
jgi:hypothetical protein